MVKAQEIVPVETITCDPTLRASLVHAKGEETCPAGYYFLLNSEVCTGDDGRCEEVSRHDEYITTSVEDLLPGTLYQYNPPSFNMRGLMGIIAAVFLTASASATTLRLRKTWASINSTFK
ncbi:hypothetical protein SPFM7_00089 [Salmonella phage SPFM7]|nr:hypothetical protein SPFM7_00089 [Salmonella phage SPFM7]